MNNFRNEVKANFTAIPNVATNDARLSWKAKGIFLYLASKPDSWQFYMDEIEQNATDGKTSLQSGLKELEKFGYLTRVRSFNDKNQFAGWDWILQIPDKAVSRLSGIPANGNSDQRKTTPDNKTDSTKTDNSKTDINNWGADCPVEVAQDIYSEIQDKFKRVAAMAEPLSCKAIGRVMDKYMQEFPAYFPHHEVLQQVVSHCLGELNDHRNSTKRYSAEKNLCKFIDNHIAWHLDGKKEAGQQLFTIQEANAIYMDNFAGTNGTGTPFNTVFDRQPGPENGDARYKINPQYAKQIKSW